MRIIQSPPTSQTQGFSTVTLAGHSPETQARSDYLTLPTATAIRYHRLIDSVSHEFPPDEWYFDNLPAPWNVPPIGRDWQDVSKAAREADIPIFDGETGYFEWRDLVIPLVHQIPDRRSACALAIRRLCDLSSPFFGGVFPMHLSGEALYKAIIDNLEERFGGAYRALNTIIGKIESAPLLRAGRPDDLDSLRQDVAQYTNMLRAEAATQPEMALIYNIIYSKMPYPYKEEFESYLKYESRQRHSTTEELRSIHTWQNWARQRSSTMRTISEFSQTFAGSTMVTHTQEETLPSDRRVNYVNVAHAHQSRSVETAREEVPQEAHDTPVQRNYNYQGDYTFCFDLQGRDARITMEQALTCPRCDPEKHPLSCCEIFLGMTVAQRRNFVAEKELCLRCLVRGHSLTECGWPKRCGESQCEGDHHILLHTGKPQQRKQQGIVSSAGYGTDPPNALPNRP
jgi:hypothetical protein